MVLRIRAQSHDCHREGGLMGTVTDTLVERLDELLQHQGERQLAWGNPLLSTTPTSVAIRDLAMRVEALEEAVREIALEVQRRAGDA
jgi:hypothetical protein